MAARKRSRLVLGLGAAALVGATLVYGFWPRPMLVDIGTVARGPLIVTIDEEARTQVHDAFVVSSPVAGRLLRSELEPGDPVEGGKTVVARLLPAAPAALDARSREQALARSSAAEAALRVARADLKQAEAAADLAHSRLDRTERLAAGDLVSASALDAARAEARRADAIVETARAAIGVRMAELRTAQANLIAFDDQRLGEVATGRARRALPLHAPVDGVVLRVMQRSETTVQAGTPLVEIGNVAQGLEVVADLLSTDAVRIAPGADVIIDGWGGDNPLAGTVRRIAPWATTRVSALGIEEQRVRVTIGLTGPPEARGNLGHGFRVLARIIVWHDDAAILVPSGALFRDGPDWSVFAVQDGTARQRRVFVAANNGISAAVSDGLEPGQAIVLYPPAGLEDGQAVAPRSAY